MVAARIEENLARVFLLRNTRKANCGIVRAFGQTELIAQHRRVPGANSQSILLGARSLAGAWHVQ